MSRKALLKITIPVLFLVLLGGLWALNGYYANLPERISQHETIVLGQNQFVPGSQAALRVVVRDSKDAAPLPGAEITVSLQPAGGGMAVPVYTGLTDDQGSANVTFSVPLDADPSQTLIVETTSALGSDFIERQVTLDRDYRVLLTTDKPLYQPGQLIHVRVLALSTFDLTPAGAQDLEIVIADGKGNKVYRETLTTSAYGVAATDFQLASEVNTGPYKITATLGNTSSEKTVTVEHYVLPKFAVNLSTDRTFYLPGENVAGTLSANYFFGKPVAGGEVLLEGYTFDVERVVAVTLQGTTDDNGDFKFAFDLPAYIAGTELEGGLGRFYVQVTVTDLTEHSETSNLSLPVAQNALVIDAIPEGGQFRPGVENILYVLTSYPDGTPAETSLTVEFYDGGDPVQVASGPYGLAEVRMTPQSPYQSFNITATDVSGNEAWREFYFEGNWSEETVLLRPDKPVYFVGDTMVLTLLTSVSQGTVYLDIVREGQTVSTRAVEVNEGRVEVGVDLTPDLYGTLELHAYKILHSGNIDRDTRLVVVDNAADLNVALTPGEEVYRPGDPASLDILVADWNGSGAQAAIGLAIVDESVFALAEQDPGFAKLYFLLEQELLQPKYDLHGFSVPDLVGGVPVSAQPTVDAIEDAAQASLAAATPWMSNFTLQANSHQDAVQRAYTIQERYFSRQSTVVYAFALLVPLVLLGLSIVAVWQEKNLGRSLGFSLAFIVFIVVLVLIWPLGDDYWWVETPLDRLGMLFDWLSWNGEGLVMGLALLALLGFLALVGVAWRRRDRSLGWMVGMLSVFVVIFLFLAFSVSKGNIYPDTDVVLWGMLAFFMLPLAFLVRGTSFVLERRILPAVAALLVALFLLVGGIPALAIGQGSAAAVRGMAFRGGIMIEEPMMGEVMMDMDMAAPMPEAQMEFAVEETETKSAPDSTDGATSPEPPRLRQFFPETMLWMPDLVTEEDGSLTLEFPVADSITTWRMTALASTQDGRLGSATAGLRVFQDFFIDLDLPLALTVGDEVSVPVGVFNYLETGQIVSLELEQSAWFELLDEPVKEIEIAANDISVVYFRVRALDFGQQPFKVTAWGSQMSDAIQKEVRVYPDGRQITFTYSDRLALGTPVNQTVSIPAEAIPGTQSLVVKIYPGILSQVVEGLDSILRMPFGCFEQTSSTTYPNVLVLDYLKVTNQASPETQLKAEEYINLGYQRLTTFEVGTSGGFSLFGDAPADRMLTAYGLQEFADMSRVHDVDPALIQRAAEWLLSQQAGDGTWENDRGLVHENTWASLGDDRLPVTAYIVWSLVEAGYGDDPRTQQGLAYVRENQTKATHSYVVALVANTLVAADLAEGDALDGSTEAVLERLAGLAVMEGNGASWTSGVATFMGSEGQTGSIETTALAALAFLRADSHPELANAALTYLVQQKDNFGTWYSTQATVLALKALIQSVRAGAENVNATVTVSLNGSQERTVQVTAENFDVVQLLSFDDVNIGRDNTIEISVEGEGNLMYQISGGYYLPWDKLALYPELAGGEELVTIDVTYDRTELSVNDTVEVDVTVTLNDGQAESALIDLGLPPGFTVQAEDLAALVAYFNDVPDDYAFPTIERYELTGRQILIYVSNLSAGQPLQFSYRLRAKFPVVAQTPASNAYDYYNPDVNGETEPQMLVVAP